jgi:hypothetical protein
LQADVKTTALEKFWLNQRPRAAAYHALVQRAHIDAHDVPSVR